MLLHSRRMKRYALLAALLAVLGKVEGSFLPVTQVKEGHAGILFFGGAANKVLPPGLHVTCEICQHAWEHTLKHSGFVRSPIYPRSSSSPNDFAN